MSAVQITYTATTARDIIEFILAETMVAGEQVKFETREGVSIRVVAISGAELVKRITADLPLEGAGYEWVEYTDTKGRTTFAQKNGGSFYGTYHYAG